MCTSIKNISHWLTPYFIALVPSQTLAFPKFPWVSTELPWGSFPPPAPARADDPSPRSSSDSFRMQPLVACWFLFRVFVKGLWHVNPCNAFLCGFFQWAPLSSGPPLAFKGTIQGQIWGLRPGINHIGRPPSFLVKGRKERWQDIKRRGPSAGEAWRQRRPHARCLASVPLKMC